MKIIIHWIVLVIAVMAVAYFVPGIHVASVTTALIAGAFLAFINIVLKPVIKILTLPINLFTFGLFSLVVNAVLFYLLTLVVTGFSIDTYLAAFIGAFIVSVINWIGDLILY